MRKFEIVNEPFRKTSGNIILPTRATKNSAGYDIYTPIDFVIKPGFSVLLPTDVKVCMESDEVFMLYVRSSIGIKKHLMLGNGTGIIDSDYYNNSDNDGNICLSLYNYGTEEQSFKAGERIAQGVFLKYLTTDDKPLKDERIGGIGSSGN